MAVKVIKQNVGVDISKDDFKVSFHQLKDNYQSRIKASRTFKNTLTGFKAFVQWMQRHSAKDVEIRITIEDSGQGIPPEVLPHIFEPFYTTKDVGHGTGLGLSISHKVIEDHGGRIEVQSTPGEGSRFSFYLPIKEPPGDQRHGQTDEGLRSAASS